MSSQYRPLAYAPNAGLFLPVERAAASAPGAPAAISGSWVPLR
jgi:hypothetical protein